ncbi:MAG: dTMP kinase [Caldilineaceae bacterium SB0670_bin_27]|uniref:Thymidylate kinase n=1 Tax=Caldilineaceae bacterium SB0664_bin_27 TaxID=2605260 RepID=A0A6B0Z0T3_9CHLR|nr:dTMP kinase [Caldilineaceae bacterium SB0664_bin_27]MYJ77863.1 dTMP kinase [Caldilineaceae bacterium SB0670_bin_27]
MFITFEGSDGSGKSTQIHLLEDYLRKSGQNVQVTREPGGTDIGERIRQVLLDMEHEKMHARTETLLFNAARAQLIEQEIRPALSEGKVVLCDRFADSTVAYQGYGREQDIEELRRLISFATGGLSPDLTFYLDLPPEEGIRRKLADYQNRLDVQGLAFYRRVEAGYHEMIAAEPGRWVIINAARSLEQVHQEVVSAVQDKLTAHAPSR